jgi:hypothetical protein
MDKASHNFDKSQLPDRDDHLKVQGSRPPALILASELASFSLPGIVSQSASFFVQSRQAQTTK